MIFVFVESFISAFASIRAHGMRSFLTMLGVIIGVASIIALVSVMEGLKGSISAELEGLGASGITVESYTPVEDQMQGRWARLTAKDLDLITYRVEGISSITPIINAGFQINYGGQTAQSQAVGTTTNFQVIRSYYTQRGRFISHSDNQTRRKVAVIGETTRNNLDLPQDPVGEFISINGEWIKVIGLLEPKGEMMGLVDMDNMVFLPYSTMLSLQGNRYEPNLAIALSAENPQAVDLVIRQIRRLLRNSHGIEGDEPEDFRIQTSEQVANSISAITTMVTAVMGGILSISLLVGGIGIMNIMLVSVTERTREIGICKAIGAKRHHILLQFLFEAVALCLMGGFIGLLIGYGLGAAAAAATASLPDAQVPLWSVMLAFGFSASVGVIFGILPAAKAANLDPIDALRFE